MDRIKILIADDEERIRDIIKEYSAPEGYVADEASDGVEALNLFKNNEYSLLVLDVMMPKLDGWRVLKEIRKSSRVPVIMLTARGEEYDRLFGFELGADDYMVKPFSPKELLARMKAVMRRTVPDAAAGAGPDKLSIGGLTVDFNSRNVFVNEKPVGLTPKEYELLAFFIRNKNRVFSREQLLNSVWGYDFAGDDRTVDTHVKMLRESLMEYRRYIKTVWGTGYKFEAEVQP